MSVNIDENNLKQGLLGLVIALLEVIQEALERQALKRIESGRLSEGEVERLGEAFMELEEALKSIKKTNGIEESVKSVRDQLDTLVDDTVNRMINPEYWVDASKSVVT